LSSWAQRHYPAPRRGCKLATADTEYPKRRLAKPDPGFANERVGAVNEALCRFVWNATASSDRRSEPAWLIAMIRRLDAEARACHAHAC
jgi:hypothetical protein